MGSRPTSSGFAQNPFVKWRQLAITDNWQFPLIQRWRLFICAARKPFSINYDHQLTRTPFGGCHGNRNKRKHLSIWWFVPLTIMGEKIEWFLLVFKSSWVSWIGISCLFLCNRLMRNNRFISCIFSSSFLQMRFEDRRKEVDRLLIAPHPKRRCEKEAGNYKGFKKNVSTNKDHEFPATTPTFTCPMMECTRFFHCRGWKFWKS